MNEVPKPSKSRLTIVPSSLSRRLWDRLLVRALIMQAAAGIGAFGGAYILIAATGTAIPLYAIVAGQGLLAALLGLKWGLDRWWIPVQLALPPALLASMALPVPSWIYGVVFLALLLVFWNATGGRVPLYLTNRRTWSVLADTIPDRPETSFIDIGCGVGGVLAYMARRRPDVHLIGIESAPIPYAITWLRLKLSGAGSVDLRFGDMWRQDLAPFDVVYCFLSPAPMPALFDKACREMQPGSLLISNSFVVPGHPADDVVTVDDRRHTCLHVWHIGLSTDGARDHAEGTTSTIGNTDDIA
jgi:SAM-dependent methyltransferase